MTHPRGSHQHTARPDHDAAYHRQEADRHRRRVGMLRDHPGRAASELAQAEIHALLAGIADRGVPIPDYVKRNLPAMIGWDR